MTAGSARNQTLSFLLRRFREVGIRPEGRLGQNFLIDLNLVRLLVQTADVVADDVVLEVGTGTGSLTALLAERAAAVVTVEVDAKMHQLAAEHLAGVANVQMLLADVLKNKNRLNPAVLEAVARARHAAGIRPRPWKLAANLPYNIATPLITNLLTLDDPPETMTVTIQKEVADRLVAAPATKDYGALSLWVQAQCDVELVRVMPPSVFFPRPKVDSAIVRLRTNRARRAAIGDREHFHSFVRSLFLHRRKYLRSVLVAALKDRLDKPGVDALLARFGLSGTERAEQLDLDTVLAMAKTVPKGR